MDQNRLVIELLAQTNPDQAIEIAKTNITFQKVVSTTLGKKHQFYFSDFRGFLEVYYTSILTDKAIKYLSPRNCLKWALQEGNIELAEKFYQLWIIFEPRHFETLEEFSYLSYEGLAGYACLSKKDEIVDWWINLNLSKSGYLRSISSEDIYLIIRSGSIYFLEKILALIQSQIELDRGDLIYYTCLSNSREMFEYVIAHFDLANVNVVIDPGTFSTLSNGSLDWNIIYTCALDTAADQILEIAQPHQGVYIDGEIGLPYRLPLNPDVYDYHPNSILKMLGGEVEFDHFFELIESNIDGRGSPDRYSVLKKLDVLIRDSSRSEIVAFRNNIINQAITLGFANIANFFQNRGYSIGIPPVLVPTNPVAQYWYREPLLKPTYTHDFITYLVSYHQLESDIDPFIPSGVHINWLVDQLLNSTVSQLDEILDYIQIDHRFDPNYRLIDLVRLINNHVKNRKRQLNKLFQDPRINLEDVQLLEAGSEDISKLTKNTLIDLHHRKVLSPITVSLSGSQVLDDYPTFWNYYLMTPDELAKKLNLQRVPWIPHLNSLIAALLLAGYDPAPPFYGTIRGQRVAPLSTIQRIINVKTIMTAR
ncbi:Hypothetical protein POVR1_LOCUS225 [uncultured virus]|nr:Hypothetical protein POVR1_LOCUS225 [uncultured virus]